jgi:hypothetical protein
MLKITPLMLIQNNGQCNSLFIIISQCMGKKCTHPIFSYSLGREYFPVLPPDGMCMCVWGVRVCSCMYGYVYVGVCVCECWHMFVYVCVRARACMCAWFWVCVWIWYASVCVCMYVGRHAYVCVHVSEVSECVWLYVWVCVDMWGTCVHVVCSLPHEQ